MFLVRFFALIMISGKVFAAPQLALPASIKSTSETQIGTPSSDSHSFGSYKLGEIGTRSVFYINKNYSNSETRTIPFF